MDLSKLEKIKQNVLTLQNQVAQLEKDKVEFTSLVTKLNKEVIAKDEKIAELNESLDALEKYYLAKLEVSESEKSGLSLLLSEARSLLESDLDKFNELIDRVDKIEKE